MATTPPSVLTRHEKGTQSSSDYKTSASWEATQVSISFLLFIFFCFCLFLISTSYCSCLVLIFMLISLLGVQVWCKTVTGARIQRYSIQPQFEADVGKLKSSKVKTDEITRSNKRIRGCQTKIWGVSAILFLSFLFFFFIQFDIFLYFKLFLIQLIFIISLGLQSFQLSF